MKDLHGRTEAVDVKGKMSIEELNTKLDSSMRGIFSVVTIIVLQEFCKGLKLDLLLQISKTRHNFGQKFPIFS